MEILRTPDERFAGLPDYDFAPHYVHVDGLRMHYVDFGPAGADPVLMLHGEPSWSYLYRRMIPIVAAAGHRVIAPDLIGFGRSDKLADRAAYTYQRHVDWVRGFVETLNLRHITLVCQDWGGLIGLRVAAEQQERFARIIASNTALPTADRPPSEFFLAWQQLSQTTPVFSAGDIVAMGCVQRPSPEVVAAYNAPFPEDAYTAGARQFPVLVPTTPDDPAVAANKRAWELLAGWNKPFLTAFSDSDPMTSGAERGFQALVPGAQGQPHTTIRGAGHFVQEDKGEEFAQIVVDFIAQTQHQRTP